MRLRGDQIPLGDRGRGIRLWRIVVILALIVAGVWITRLVEAGRVKPLFLPTPTPTRVAQSFREEGDAHFSAGDLQRAIAAYTTAANLEPGNAETWARLARIQTYASALEASTEDRRLMLASARESINQAVKADEDNAFAWAVRTFVYDWSAEPENSIAIRDSYLQEAEISSANALRLEPGDVLALAFKAEAQVDQQQFAQALDNAQAAVEKLEADYAFSMDVHRVYATVLESFGNYNLAIPEYERAAAINPNLTFLYLRIGANYRQVFDYTRALESFDRAARINEQLGINDPIPFRAIGKTYTQQGQFFIAARNLERAVALAPDNADLFGFLGIIYFKARNYESAEIVLGCAVFGCAPEVGRKLLCDQIYGCDDTDPTDLEALQYGEEVRGLLLEASSLEYYYTLGSVLAANDLLGDKCGLAETVFSELMNSEHADSIVREIVEEGRALCAGKLQTPEPPEVNA
jgi:tetratricopeptide (TPR) repeat protein